jgi:hypothetical protein
MRPIIEERVDELVDEVCPRYLFEFFEGCFIDYGHKVSMRW